MTNFQPLQIDRRIIIEQAKATITNLIDGIVELVTNSDESYLNLEEQGIETEGIIEIYIKRRKGGFCEKLIVKDYAEGMDKQTLKKALVYGSKTARIWGGKSGRGLWGRGLKETIICLGDGEIKTVKNKKLIKTKICKIDEDILVDYDFLNNPEEITDLSNGTEILINIKNDKLKIPQADKFKEQLTNHYALRDINSSSKRRIILTFQETYTRSTKNSAVLTKAEIKFKFSESEKIIEKETILPSSGDRIIIKAYETKEPLEFQSYNPFSIGGFLIKISKGIIDNQLFKFENDLAGKYFWGEILCKDLENRIQEETNILTPTRMGLNWKHHYCKEIANAVEEIIEPYVEKKRKILLTDGKSYTENLKEKTKKYFELLKLALNKIALKELTEEEGEEPILKEDINTLVIIPSFSNTQINKPRTLTILAPERIVKEEGNIVLINSNNNYLRPSSFKLSLEKDEKRPSLWKKYFKIFAYKENEKAIITIKLGKITAFTEVRVAPPKKIEKHERKSGIISEIRLDKGIECGKYYRALYKKGIIFINIEFPSTKNILKGDLNESIETLEGKILLSEIVGEVFFRYLARQSVEKEGYFPTEEPTGIIDGYNLKLSELQKKYMSIIQNIILNPDFKINI